MCCVFIVWVHIFVGARAHLRVFVINCIQTCETNHNNVITHFYSHTHTCRCKKMFAMQALHRGASLLSGVFATMTVINPLDWKLANRTFVQCTSANYNANITHCKC